MCDARTLGRVVLALARVDGAGIVVGALGQRRPDPLEAAVVVRVGDTVQQCFVHRGRCRGNLGHDALVGRRVAVGLQVLILVRVVGRPVHVGVGVEGVVRCAGCGAAHARIAGNDAPVLQSRLRGAGSGRCRVISNPGVSSVHRVLAAEDAGGDRLPGGELPALRIGGNVSGGCGLDDAAAEAVLHALRHAVLGLVGLALHGALYRAGGDLAVGRNKG